MMHHPWISKHYSVGWAVLLLGPELVSDVVARACRSIVDDIILITDGLRTRDVHVV
jgi:hypothetical protein